MIIQNEVEVVQRLLHWNASLCVHYVFSSSLNLLFFAKVKCAWKWKNEKKDNVENIGLGWKSSRLCAFSNDSLFLFLYIFFNVSTVFDVWCLALVSVDSQWVCTRFIFFSLLLLVQRKEFIFFYFAIVCLKMQFTLVNESQRKTEKKYSEFLRIRL